MRLSCWLAPYRRASTLTRSPSRRRPRGLARVIGSPSLTPKPPSARRRRALRLTVGARGPPFLAPVVGGRVNVVANTGGAGSWLTLGVATVAWRRPPFRPPGGYAPSSSTFRAFLLSRTLTASGRSTVVIAGVVDLPPRWGSLFRRTSLACASTAWGMTTSRRTVDTRHAAAPVAVKATVRATAHGAYLPSQAPRGGARLSVRPTAARRSGGGFPRCSGAWIGAIPSRLAQHLLAGPLSSRDAAPLPVLGLSSGRHHLLLCGRRRKTFHPLATRHRPWMPAALSSLHPRRHVR